MQQKISTRTLEHGREWTIDIPQTNVTNAHEPPSHLALNISNNASNNRKADAKDIDQVSIASSTHFTVVNGFGRSNVKPKSNSICRQGRQITILIVTMSVLFMIGIIGAIYLMERK